MARAATWSRWLVVTTLVLSAAAAWFPVAAAPIGLFIAAAGFAAGVPHGAIDHLAAAKLSGRASVVAFAGAYAVLAAVAWVLMAWTGPIAFGAVVVLSVLHFGLGELEVSRRLTGWRPGRLAAAAVAVAGCGALLLPLARCGPQLAAVASAISPRLADALGAAPLRVAVVVMWALAALVAVTAAVRSGRRDVAMDLGLVGVLGATAPPLVAFAVWFGGWHALRHCARMLAVEPGCARLVEAGRGGAAVRRFIGLAAWPSVAAIAVMCAAGGFTLMAPDPSALIADVLRLLLALTVPHMAVVLWLDRRGQ